MSSEAVEKKPGLAPAIPKEAQVMATILRDLGINGRLSPRRPRSWLPSSGTWGSMVGVRDPHTISVFSGSWGGDLVRASPLRTPLLSNSVGKGPRPPVGSPSAPPSCASPLRTPLLSNSVGKGPWLQMSSCTNVCCGFKIVQPGSGSKDFKTIKKHL